MTIQPFEADSLKTICWTNDNMIIDWAAGELYSISDVATTRQFGFNYAFTFDTAISSANGEYAFIYQKLGTKGLLLKNGQLLREINRSYYFAESYEFPAAFFTKEDKTYLIHCPFDYNRLDFEEVETGQIVTDIPNRNPDDFFHSRLEVSPGGSYLISKGWVWHPLDIVVAFDIEECLANPFILDNLQFEPDTGSEVCTASFIDDCTVLIGTSEEIIDEDRLAPLPPKHICLWNLKTLELSMPVKVKAEFGNLFAINSSYAWDMFSFPKIIDINTGEIIENSDALDSGKQQSAIIGFSSNFPSIIYNKNTFQIAIKGKDKFHVLTSSSESFPKDSEGAKIPLQTPPR